MKEAEMVKLRNASLAMTLVLEMDEDATNSRIDLQPGERHFIEGCRMGLLETLNTQTERLEKLLKTAKSESDQAAQKSFDLQGYLFSSNTGKPTSPADANGKLIKKPKIWANESAPEGIHENDGVQAELTEGSTSEAESGWAIAPKVPEEVESSIVEAVQAGKTQAAAVTAASKATKIAKLVIEGHVEQLIRDGKLVRESKTKLTVPVREPEPSIEELILRELRTGAASLSQVVSNVSFEAGAQDQEIEAAFHQLAEHGRIVETEAGWTAAEVGTVEMVEVPAEVSTTEAVTIATEPVDSPVVLAIFSKLDQGLTNKPTIIEAVAMQVGVPADSVRSDWETLLFLNRIERTPDGFVRAQQPAAIAG